MNSNLTEIIAILDRSGSMEHLTADTIGTTRAHFALRKVVNNYRKSGNIRKGEAWEDELKQGIIDEAKYEHDEGRYDGEI